ncbi:MAG: BlaI/MecI/CopY family transcriptional regulator [Oscillospiraceae bacterium]|jgi:predicted transcriptional regulator|nr:BlaI/MecI/CopY family transcriptional regulator [Oscillospiraceae bacterium]
MEKTRLGTMEYRFLALIWENEPVSSMELVRKCSEEFEWKKSTTFTVLRKLKEKGLINNNDSVVTSRIDRKDVEKAESESFIEQTFSGSLPHFMTAFLRGKKISDDEAEELKALIDSYRGM